MLTGDASRQAAAQGALDCKPVTRFAHLVPAAIIAVGIFLCAGSAAARTVFNIDAGSASDAPAPKRGGYARGEDFVGSASTYNPYDVTGSIGRDAGGAQTASGEIYDSEGWTAAIRTDLRWHFGGIRYGRNYQPVFALVEGAGKRVIVRVNDVGPLRPGRIIDLNDRTMRYLDPTMQIGVIENVTVTPLFGDSVAVGPVDAEPIALAGDFEWLALTPDVVGDLDDHAKFGPLLFLR